MKEFLSNMSAYVCIHVCVCVCVCFKHFHNEFPSAFLAMVIKACVFAISLAKCLERRKDIVFSWFFAQSNFGEVCDCI